MVVQTSLAAFQTCFIFKTELWNLKLFLDALLDSHKNFFFYIVDLLVVSHDFDNSFRYQNFYRVEQALEEYFAICIQQIWCVFRLEHAYGKDGRNVCPFLIFFFFEGFYLIRH